MPRRRPPARIEQDLEALAKAIRAAVAEHGTPNTFSPTDLVMFGDAPDPIRTGWLMSRHGERFAALVPPELEVQYAERTFSVRGRE